MLRLFHVTPMDNVISILEHAINPSFSKGKEKVCWYVTGARVMWAIAHVSSRHNLPVSRISVFEVDLPEQDALRTAWIGVYKVKRAVRSKRFVDAAAVVQAEQDAHNRDKHDIPW